MNPQRAMTVLLIAAIAAHVSAPAAAEELGRLFFTPAQRAELDRRDRNPVRRAPRAEPPVTVNGRVLRSSGLGTVWVNGVADHRTDEADEDARQVTLGTARGGVQVKVGQTFVPGTGVVSDGVANGIVREE